MFEIIALGGSEFTLGFRLAGVRTIETENPEMDFERLLKDPDLGIIITDDKTIQKLPEHFHYKLEGLVKPVTLVLSLDTTAQDALRNMIIKSIGVDLWKNG